MLAPGEKITKVKYGLRKFKSRYCLCELVFYTNMDNKYGPYGRAKSTRGYYEGKKLTIIFSRVCKSISNSLLSSFK